MSVAGTAELQPPVQCSHAEVVESPPLETLEVHLEDLFLCVLLLQRAVGLLPEDSLHTISLSILCTRLAAQLAPAALAPVVFSLSRFSFPTSASASFIWCVFGPFALGCTPVLLWFPCCMPAVVMRPNRCNSCQAASKPSSSPHGVVLLLVLRGAHTNMVF